MSAPTWAPPQGEPARPRPPVTGRAFLALAICVLVVGLLGILTPNLDEEVQTDYHDVAVGEQGQAQDFDATATSVRVGRSVLATEYDRTADASPGAVFVVVAIAADVREDTTVFNGIELITKDDHHYAPRSELISFNLQVTQPGFTGRGTVVFEVPEERLAGARLVIGPDKGSFEFYDTAIRVDLALNDPVKISEAKIPIAPFVLEVTR